MIVVLKPGVCEEKKSQLTDWLAGQGLSVHPALGGSQTILGLVGDPSRLDTSLLESLEIVDSVKPVSDPFKCCNRKFHPDDTVISVGEAKFGGGHFSMIAGPCSVESEEQIVAVAQSVKAAGAQVLRGGAFKPRTSPYDFQGLHELGLRFLETAKRETTHGAIRWPPPARWPPPSAQPTLSATAAMSTTQKPGCTICRAGIITRAGVGLSMRTVYLPLARKSQHIMRLHIVEIIQQFIQTNRECGLAWMI